MTWIRSAIFNVAFFAWTTIVVIVAVPLLAFPQKVMVAYARCWSWSVLLLLRLICGLRYRILGKVPEGGVIIACKHQSAWDTIAFFQIVASPVYILKRELLMVPLFGWCLLRSGMIAIDRKGGASTMRKTIAKAAERLAEKRQIVIFPQGTRVAPGVKAPYQPGAVGLYTHLDTAIVPAALDSGRFWARRSFLKKPGTITLEFLEPIPPGLKRSEVQRLLEERIEAASDRLIQSG